MDYTEFFKEIKKASLFDLHRISDLVYNEINSPERIREVKRRLKSGMGISYFDLRENRLVDAVIIELRRKRVLVRNNDDHRKWVIDYAAVNLEGVPIDVSSSAMKGLDRSQLKVGDTVGFYYSDEEVYGKVIKLNPKKAKVETAEGAIWRVPYSMLLRVFEGNTTAGSNVIDVQVIQTDRE
ncbi:MAG: hypothetical protein GY940_45240 [bacterium]|nr:hypothetical protein [bacterium]